MNSLGYQSLSISGLTLGRSCMFSPCKLPLEADINAHIRYFDDTVSSGYYHKFQVWVGNRKEVQYTEDGRQKTIYVASADLDTYQIDENDFTESIKKTEEFIKKFDWSASSYTSARNDIGTIVRALRDSEQALNTIDDNTALALLRTRSWNPWSSRLLVVEKTATGRYTAQKVSTTLLGKGGFARVYAAGERFVVRELRNKKEQTGLDQAARVIQTINDETTGQEGIEPRHRRILQKDASGIFSASNMTLTPRALGSCRALLNKKHPFTEKEKALIANHIIQGVQRCIDAHICHLDIKTANILLYGTKDSTGKMQITDAKISDFDGAIDLQRRVSDELWITCDKRIMAKDWNAINATSSAERDTALQAVNRTMYLQVGIALYELYTGKNILNYATYDRYNHIEDFNMGLIILELQESHVPKNMHEYIMKCLTGTV